MSKNHPWRMSTLYPDAYREVSGAGISVDDLVEAVMSLPAYTTDRSIIESRTYKE